MSTLPDKPAIDYTDKDFESLRAALLSLATYRLPEWTDRSPSDIGMLLVDLFAYMGDVVSYYQDRIASESYLETAVERRSVLSLLRLIGYELAPPVAASVEVTLTFNPPAAGQPTVVTIPEGAGFATKAGQAPAQPFVYLGPARDVDLAGDGVTTDADGKLVLAGLPLRHGTLVRAEIVGSSTGEPNQRFELGASPIILETLVVEVDEGAGFVAWQRRQNLVWHISAAGDVVTSAADARDYYVEFDEDGRAAVVFGDGEAGRRPPPATDNIRATYASGGGAAGNVPAGAIMEAKPPIPGLAAVTNPLPASGGADGEPIERAAQIGPRAFRSGDRAVTLNDYVTIAKQSGGVEKVRARTTGWNRVELYVVPAGSEITAATAEQKQRLVAYFETRRMLGTSVHVLDPRTVRIDISVAIITEHNHPADVVRDQAQRAVERLLSFDRVDFGQPLYLSKVYEAVEAIEGVHAATVTRFRRRDQVAPRTLRRKILLEAGLGDVSAFVERAFAGEIALEGRIDIGEVEIAVPGLISVVGGNEAS